jgi:tetratricopeptide (TPR) repeat protein
LEMARGMLADVEVEDLRSLVDEGFLLVRGDRWLLHPLMGRLVGQALVAADQDRESHQKAINYFLLNLKSEVSSIEDCTEHFEVFHHWCELGKYALANQIMDNCVNFLNLRGYYRELLTIYERLTKVWSIAQSDDTQEQRNLGWAWQRAGKFYHSLGYYPAAINAYQQAQILFDQLDSLDKAAPLNGLGSAYYLIGEYLRAINFYQQSLAIQRDIGDQNGEAASLGNLGNAYNSIGEYQRAINFHQQSLAIQRDIGDRNGEAVSLVGLGNAYISIGEYQRAINFHQQSLAIQRDIGDRNGEAVSLANLGSAYYLIGEYQRAINFYQQSLAIRRDIGDRNGEAASLNGLGSAYYSVGEYQRAIDFHQQSLAIQRDIGDREGEAISCHNLNLLYQQRGQFRKSRSYRLQAYRIWQELQLPLAELPFSDFQKRMFQYLGEDWIEQQIQNEQKLAWLYDSISLISFVIRWFFSPMRWIRKRLRSKN